MHYLPWRIVHLVKVWFFALVLWPVVPLVSVACLTYFVLSFVIDKTNLLCLLEPPPPSSGLCMRFCLSCIMPAAIPVHLFVAIFGYVGKLRYDYKASHVYDGSTAGNMTVEDALATPQLLFYLVYAVIVIWWLIFDCLVLQRDLAVSRGLLTPWQVFTAAFKADRGFSISSAAEPFPDVRTPRSRTNPDPNRNPYPTPNPKPKPQTPNPNPSPQPQPQPRPRPRPRPFTD